MTRRPLTRAQARGQEIPEQERMDAYWSELCACGHGRHLHLNARGTGACAWQECRECQRFTAAEVRQKRNPS